MGPLGVFLVSLARCGGRLDASWKAYFSWSAVVDVMQDSWIFVKASFVDRHFDATFLKAAGERTSMQCLGRVDWRSSLRRPKDFQRRDHGLMRALHAGGVWSDKDRHKA
eukprot:1527600-Alexandrium_andersonii.AAC.1